MVDNERTKFKYYRPDEKRGNEMEVMLLPLKWFIQVEKESWEPGEKEL